MSAYSKIKCLLCALHQAWHLGVMWYILFPYENPWDFQYWGSVCTMAEPREEPDMRWPHPKGDDKTPGSQWKERAWGWYSKGRLLTRKKGSLNRNPVLQNGPIQIEGRSAWWVRNACPKTPLWALEYSVWKHERWTLSLVMMKTRGHKEFTCQNWAVGFWAQEAWAVQPLESEEEQ